MAFQKTEYRRQMTEDRRQRSDDKVQVSCLSSLSYAAAATAFVACIHPAPLFLFSASLVAA